MVSAGAYVRYRSVWDSIRRIDVTGLGDRPAKYNNGFNVLLIGSDSRAGQNRRFRAGIQGQRSDTIMLLHISPDHHHVTVVSIPRDTVVGSINDIGGVRICLPAAISDRDSGLNLAAGVHHVMGAQALAFWRERHIGLRPRPGGYEDSAPPTGQRIRARCEPDRRAVRWDTSHRRPGAARSREMVVQVSGYGGGFGDGFALRHEAEERARRREDAEEREDKQGRQVADDNAATAPGKVCELCGSVITAGQEARLRPDGWWIHEACPIQ